MCVARSPCTMNESFTPNEVLSTDPQATHPPRARPGKNQMAPRRLLWKTRGHMSQRFFPNLTKQN